ncbi:MAG: ornithine carbamoyltransferase [Peptococcaceae bacterium]|nr:ornithine carbamoyltransferase [Peptococcaceae bacterium]MBT9157573.1 Ornithine carbamoyltransferase [Bacillota bacterium]
MSVTLKGRHFISLHDFTQEELWQVFKTTEMMKLKQKMGEPFQPLKGKTLGMIFQKASTRTRISFEVGMWQLGGYALFLSANDLQLKRGETIADTARVLSRYVDGIMIRTYAHQDVLDLAKYGSIPIINGLTDLLHPCQVAADLFTIWEKKNRLQGLKLVYIGDGNNMAHSLLFGCAKMGLDVTICSPSGYLPDANIVRLAKEDALLTGAKVVVTGDVEEGVRGADVVYTDVWASMGQEAEHAKRVKDLMPYQVNAKLMQLAKPDALFLHCLPAHRNEEVTDEVIDGPQSVVWDEAENRLHVQKAIMALVM